MPDLIVIAGGGRRVGKTRLAEELGRILPDAAVVKVGVHHARPGKNRLFFDRGATARQISAAAGDRRFLIVESGAILDDPDLDPALVIFLPAPGGDKPGSEARRTAAHIVRGERQPDDLESRVAQRLGIDLPLAREVVAAALDPGITPAEP
jgi:hypothetical protein